MYEIGTRFNKDFYIKTSIDPTSGECSVMVEVTNNEGVTEVVTGTVVWDE